MMQSLDILRKILLACIAAKAVADISRDGANPVVITAVIIIIVTLIRLLRTRVFYRKTVFVDVAGAEQRSTIFRQLSAPDRGHIAGLVASGNAIAAIKTLRKLVDVDLRTAKNVIDQLSAPHLGRGTDVRD